MGGHGGLNILPQKRWNVYNFDNREKVRLDEEAAAKEEQLKREQSRKRDTELRLEQLRQARGLPASSQAEVKDKPSSSSVVPEPVAEPAESAEPLISEVDSQHINLFEGIRIFDPIKPGDEKRIEKKSRFTKDENRNKKVKREEVRVVGPEDEKYKLGYGIAGKGVKLPWYMEKRVSGEEDDDEEEYDELKHKEKRKSGGKKTLEELREERLKREKSEKERERALLMAKSKKDGGFSSRRR